MSAAFTESRRLTPEELAFMLAAAERQDFREWAGPVIDAMNELMAAVALQMAARGLRPQPGAYSFTLTFEAEAAKP